MSPTALVTGATGFVGAALTRQLLRSGWSVAIVTRPSSDFSAVEDFISQVDAYVYDGKTQSIIEILEKVRPDVVFHVASLVLTQHTPEQVESLISSNVLFGTQLLEAMVLAGVKKFINTSTTWQYFGEENKQSVNLYAATKKAYEEVIDYYNDAHDISVISLVLSDTYGIGDRRVKLINLLIDAVRRDEKISMSPGDQIVDVSHVYDVVRSFESAAQDLIEATSTVNLKFAISGARLSVKELVAEVERVSGKKINAEFGGRAYRIREVMAPPVLPLYISKWSKVDLGEGIKELLNSQVK